MSPVSSRSFASWMTSSGSPSLREISNALDLPGTPVINLNVGDRVSTSNCMDAFCTPSVEIAYFFNSV